MRTMKRVAAVALSVVVLMTSGVSAKAAVTDVQPAKSSSEAVLKWAKKVGEPFDEKTYANNTVSKIKLVGNYLYVADDAKHRIMKIDKKDGTILKEQKYYDESYIQGYVSSIGYGDNKVYVGYDNGRVQAFDENTLESLWITDENKNAINADFVFTNGKLYFGTTAKTTDWYDNGAPFSYYVVTTSDDDKTKPDEEKTMKKVVESKTGKFYSKKGVVLGKYIVISDTAGTLTMIDTTNDKVTDTKDIGEAFSGNITYDEMTGTIYFVAGTNDLYGIKVSADGKLKDEKKVRLYETGYSATTPEVYNGKVYVSGSKGKAFQDKGYMAVADVSSDKYKVNYTVELSNYSQCEPTIVKTGENSVRVYFTINDEPGGIYAIEDSKDATSATLETVYEPTGDIKNTGCMSDVVVDEDGTIYFANDSKYIMSVGKKVEDTKKSDIITVKPVTKTVKSTRSVKLTWKKKKSAKGYVIYAKAGKGKYKKGLDFQKESLYPITSEVTDKGVKQLVSYCLSPLFFYYQLDNRRKYIDYASNVREERKNSMKEKINVSEIFGSHVFNDSVMKARLPKAVYKDLKKTIEEGTELNPAIADVVANEMKEWAIEKGATHYTHWFQPLTGVTAEKHDAFINPTDDGKVLLEFSGKELIKGEPDASSFPSGGLRATFEARGYTAWDCTSPAFIKETDNACILCIPTAFCSYKGEALDKKTPLLRSMQALDIQATRLLNVLGNKNVKRVSTSVGPEQEYFLVDEEKYKQRKDLIFTGRTLFGAMPPKGQEMDDHYFGIIKPRIEGFMKDLNIEAWKLGISAKTEHNEVAPAQHELAPIYNSNNVATDHNQLLMETMRRVARRHGLKCLLHEKPFAGINGSGKHNNWSMVTNEGKNLLDPGKTPHENQQFLLILASIIAAVDKHADLLRMSASTPGNDHRLGANEAPPAIISIFLGDQLEDVVKQLVTRGEATESKHGDKLASGVHSLPAFEKDATDRNRTSPFAFTGNKFEFRMVGSTQSISDPNVVLNTIVADVFADVCDRLEKVEGGVEAVAMEAHEITKELLTQHQRVIFNGNGYSDEWVAEAERRGLPNLHSMVDAIPTLTTDKSVKMFEKFGVYTKEELESRVEVLYEQYSNTINIEGLATLDIAKKQIVPAVMKYQRKLANGVAELKTVGVDSSVQEKLLEDITANLKDLFAAINKLEADIPEAQALESEAQARCYHDTIFTDMSAVREPADKLEMLVAKEDWPMPSYGDLIFEV